MRQGFGALAKPIPVQRLFPHGVDVVGLCLSGVFRSQQIADFASAKGGPQIGGGFLAKIVDAGRLFFCGRAICKTMV